MKAIRKNKKNIFLAFFLITFFSMICCNPIFYKKHLTGIFYLIACDGEEEMSIQGNLVVVNATVFAVGYDNDFIIAKQHPREFTKPIDKSITNYYIISINDYCDEAIGPLTLEQFNKKRKALNVSDSIKFTIEFEKLK